MELQILSPSENSDQCLQTITLKPTMAHWVH